MKLVRPHLIMKKIILLIALIAQASFCFAEGPGWYPATKVKRIVVIVNGGVNVKFENETKNCASLSGYGKRYASVYPEHPGLDRIHAILLAAYMADKEVQVHFADDTCKINEVVIGGSYL